MNNTDTLRKDYGITAFSKLYSKDDNEQYRMIRTYDEQIGTMGADGILFDSFRRMYDRQYASLKMARWMSEYESDTVDDDVVSYTVDMFRQENRDRTNAERESFYESVRQAGGMSQQLKDAMLAYDNDYAVNLIFRYESQTARLIQDKYGFTHSSRYYSALPSEQIELANDYDKMLVGLGTEAVQFDRFRRIVDRRVPIDAEFYALKESGNSNQFAEIHEAEEKRRRQEMDEFMKAQGDKPFSVSLQTAMKAYNLSYSSLFENSFNAYQLAHSYNGLVVNARVVDKYGKPGVIEEIYRDEVYSDGLYKVSHDVVDGRKVGTDGWYKPESLTLESDYTGSKFAKKTLSQKTKGVLTKNNQSNINVPRRMPNVVENGFSEDFEEKSSSLDFE